jgi:hypothetical protein
MSTNPEHDTLGEKHTGAIPAYEAADGHHDGVIKSDDPETMGETGGNKLKQDLKGRHMQMIAM